MAAAVRALPQQARTAERQRLADAISAHADSVAQHERVAQALDRLDNDMFDRLQPELRKAREALEDAIAAAPELLVAKALGEPIGAEAGLTVAEAERALEVADKALADARKARSILRDEGRRAEIAVDAAKRDLDRAVSNVVSASAARTALMTAFNRASADALACARALRTAGMIVQGFQGSGLMFRIGGAPTTTNTIGSGFVPDPSWAATLATLREDADAVLPGLPQPEPDDDAGDGTAASAA